MIEQKKIALISNRTYQSGGRRIPESVIERDYCLSWFLIGLSHFPISKKLVFKGGTALRCCYFADYRHSEDLDFTLVEEMLLADILTAFGEIFSYVKDAVGIPFGIGSQEKPSLNTFTFTMTYEGPLPGKPREVKTDVTFREKILRPVHEKPILQSYPEYSDFELDARIKVYSLEEIVIEKVCALLSPARNEPRDLYDIWYILKNVGLDLSHLVSDIEEKIKFKDANLDEQRSQFDKKEKRLEALWNKRLDAQMSILPEFTEVYRIVKRAMRQAGITILILGAVFPAWAKIHYLPGTSMIQVKNKIQKHFDHNQDGYLSMVENSHYQTHLRMNYPLAKKSRQIPYDTDDDGMLEPGEWRLYLLDKEAGTLKKPTKGEVAVVAGDGLVKYSKKQYDKRYKREFERIKKAMPVISY